jgi:serine protease Do
MAALGYLQELERETGRLIERIAPSVVEVRAGHGQGAGTIWRSDGLIVTNHHVAPYDRADVTFADGTTLPGRVIARDHRNDLAVLSVGGRVGDRGGAGGLRAAAARTTPVRTGELVIAVGHPFGVRYAVATGIVSSASVIAEGIERPLIRADVALGPGNSGGPLIDAIGRVVGINAMVGGGMALAIPSTLAEWLVQAAVARAAA